MKLREIWKAPITTHIQIIPYRKNHVVYRQIFRIHLIIKHPHNSICRRQVETMAIHGTRHSRHHIILRATITLNTILQWIKLMQIRLIWVLLMDKAHVIRFHLWRIINKERNLMGRCIVYSTTRQAIPKKTKVNDRKLCWKTKNYGKHFIVLVRRWLLQRLEGK